MYSNDNLVIFDADGTTIDAFSAIGKAFGEHGLDLGDLARFQKRRKLFKYLGGLEELPKNLATRLKLGKSKRRKVVETLTDLYRDEVPLYGGIADLMNRLIEADRVRVGVVTRNITHEPEMTLAQLYHRNGVDAVGFDFLAHVPLGEGKDGEFRSVRERFEVNPARAHACGDERSDYRAALATGMHPLMVSYGFEDYDRLVKKIGVPAELISRDPDALRERLLHALGIA